MSQVWMVTGSGAGLGKAIVEAALGAGHRVVATARNSAALDELAAQYPQQMLAVALDVGVRADWDAALAAALERFGVVDVLVNNAGFGAVGAVEHTPIGLVQQLVDTNLFGAIHASQALVPQFRRQGHGRLIFISSIGARIATPGAAYYYATKAAVSAFAESLAAEVAPLGIQVTAVEPGGMRTRFAEPSSLKVAPADPAYAGTVGATLAMMQSPEYAASLSDPAGHAALVLQVAALAQPPVRLLAGADAVMYGASAAAALAAADEHWKAIGQSATS